MPRGARLLVAIAATLVSPALGVSPATASDGPPAVAATSRWASTRPSSTPMVAAGTVAAPT